MTIEDLKDKIYESKLNIKDSLYIRQLELELESVSIGVAKAREEILKAKQNGTYSTSKAGIVLVYQLMQPLAKALVEFIQNSHKGSSIKDMELSELLQKVKLDKASFIILRTILNFMCNKDSVKILTLSTGISKALLDELNIENFKQSEGNARLVLDIEARDAKRCKSKDRTKAFLYSVMEDKGIAKEILDKEHLVTFGHKLILIFNQATGLLKIRQKKIGKHSAYVVEPTLELAGYIESIEGHCELLNPLVYPMIAPPKDHAPNTYGGFYSGIESLRVPLVKDVSKRHKSYLKDLKIPLVYSAINIIQQTKWCINTRVLEVFKHYLELGIDISELDIPSLDEIPLPPSPYDKTMDKEAFTKFKEENQNLIRSYQTACSEVYSRNAANRSKRILYKTLVNIATKFKDEQGIYFCYDLDWRGRVYSVQSGHCPNPQGMGISKALLKFAEGKAIGSSGGKWLSLHGANAFGDDKLSLEDRFKWTYENERDIIAVAKDPYENKWWWEADDVEAPNNSATADLREKLLKAVKEFEAILTPKPESQIIYLGTPQTEESIYNKLRKTGFDCKIWTAEVPVVDTYNGALAETIVKSMEQGIPAGTPTDPKRFTSNDLEERRLSYGKSGYALQFMLDTSLSDSEKYPLKTGDIVVTNLLKDKAPVSISYGSSPAQQIKDLPLIGFEGDRWFYPLFCDTAFAPYTGSVMAIDPSGRGKDETGYAVVKHLHGKMFVTASGGLSGGYSEKTLLELARIAKENSVNEILIEKNFGDGMYSELFKPILQAVHNCRVEEVSHNTQKEKRIIDTLEPVLNQHRLVFDYSVVKEDLRPYLDGSYDPKAFEYSLFYQLTRITRDKGSLKHDDRLDALAMAVAYWVKIASIDSNKLVADYQRRVDEELIIEYMKDINNIKYKNSSRYAKVI